MKNPNPILGKNFESYFWVRPEGRGTFQESPLIQSVIKEKLGQGQEKFVIDLEACPGMDSTFMGMLAGEALKFKKQGKGELVVVGTSKKTKASLVELGLKFIIKIDPEDAEWSGRLDEAREGMQPIGESKEGVEGKEDHIRKCHEELCDAEPKNLEKFGTVLDVMGSTYARGGKK